MNIIDKDGDLTVEVIEYGDQVEDGTGNRPVARTLQFRVRQEVLIKNSSYFAVMFRPSHWREAQGEPIKLEEDIWFRIMHDTDLVYDVPLEEMWRLVTACDKTWAITSRDRRHTHLLDPRSLFYPCWIFDHAKGFMRATQFLSYHSTGHITEHSPTIHRDLRLESRVIQQLNAAKGRLRTVIHNELFRPNENLLKASCRCKETTLFRYKKALYTIEVWPLERTCQRSPMTTILTRLNSFSFEGRKDACRSCRIDYKKHVVAAQIKTQSYFDGLCLDCMDITKPVTKDADMDYWEHDALGESDLMGQCRVTHHQPTWYFSFMGLREVMDRFLRDKRARENSPDSG